MPEDVVKTIAAVICTIGIAGTIMFLAHVNEEIQSRSIVRTADRVTVLMLAMLGAFFVVVLLVACFF